MTENLPDSLRQFTDKSRPKELRLMAARGLVPATPKDITLILYFLTLDEDADVVGEARKTLKAMPADVISNVLSDTGTHPGLLDYFARVLEDEALLLQIVINTSASDESIAYLAEKTHSQRLIELISHNHERVARSDAIVESLSGNPAVSRSTLDGVIEFLKLYLGKKSGIPELLVSEEETSPDKGETAQVIDIELLDRLEGSFLDDIELDTELLEDTEEEEEHAP